MLKLGKYRHYKGNEYEVVAIAKESDTFVDVVVYQGLYGDHPVWVRPLKEFEEQVEVNGERVPRFKRIND